MWFWLLVMRTSFTVPRVRGEHGTQLRCVSRRAPYSSLALLGLGLLSVFIIACNTFADVYAKVEIVNASSSDELIKYLLYINNTAEARTDVSVQDVLNSSFAYQTGSIKVDNSVTECAAIGCTAAEEDSIFASVDGQAAKTDAVDSDVVSYTATTIDIGNQNQANAQLDIAADMVWAIQFTVEMQ